MQELIVESNAPKPSEEKKKRVRSNSIPIKAYFRACVRNWYWFVISVIVCASVMFLRSKSQTETYQASTLIMTMSDASLGSSTQSRTFSDLGVVKPHNNLPNEIYKIKNVTVMEEVVKALGLNVQYYGHVYLRDVNIYKHSPVQVTPLNNIESNYSVTVKPTSTTEFEFTVDGGKQWKRAKFGNKVNTVHGPVAITKTPRFNANYVGYTVIARFYTTASMAAKLKASVNASMVDKASDVINVTHTSDNVELSKDVLNALIIAYNNEGIKDKNRVAQSTEDFIAGRIDGISRDLSGVDSRIAQLKSASAPVVMYSDPSSGQKFQESAADATVQLNIASAIRSQLAGTAEGQLLPANTGIAEGGIERQISAYNDAVLKYQKLATGATAESPVMQDLTKSLASMRANIMQSLNNYIGTLSVKSSQAQAQKAQAVSSMQQVPGHEKAINEVTRQQHVKEQLFLYLLNKREENALQMAITEPNAKVIEAASGSSVPLSPSTPKSVMAGILAGLMIPAAILYIIYWILSLDTTIHSRHDVEELTAIPIIGEIPSKKHDQKNEEIVVSENSRDRIAEALRIVRTNLDFIVKEEPGRGTIIQFTSTMPNEGKSFLTLNLALTYAHVDKKVAVVDLDLRKGRFSDYVGIDAPVGVSAYLNGKISDVEDIIHKGVHHNNLDIVALGSIPPNPTGLLLSDNLKKLLEELRARYDYILLDTVPFGMVADASLINRLVDITLYVIRDGKIDKKYLLDLEKMNNEKKFHNLGIIINDIKVDAKNYGYGNYGYGYGYGHEMTRYDYYENPREAKERKKKEKKRQKATAGDGK